MILNAEDAYEELKRLYINGHMGEQPCDATGQSYWGPMQLEDGAHDSFSYHYEMVREMIAEEIRDEMNESFRQELRELDDDLDKAQSRVEFLERKIESLVRQTLQETRNTVQGLTFPETASEDIEKWAYNDGWNAALHDLDQLLVERINEE